MLKPDQNPNIAQNKTQIHVLKKVDIPKNYKIS